MVINVGVTKGKKKIGRGRVKKKGKLQLQLEYAIDKERADQLREWKRGVRAMGELKVEDLSYDEQVAWYSSAIDYMEEHPETHTRWLDLPNWGSKELQIQKLANWLRLKNLGLERE